MTRKELKESRIGIEKYNNNQELMKCIEYHNSNNIIVEFQDQWKERTHCAWREFTNGSVRNPHYYKHRVGQTKYNKENELMKIVEYRDANHITVEFQDEHKEKTTSSWREFVAGTIINPYKYKCRTNMEKINYQGCLMKCIEYKNASTMIIEFQDKYKYRKTVAWREFENGSVKNPFYPTVCDMGIIGIKYPRSSNGKLIKEYCCWSKMLKQCKDNKAICCDEWLYFPNFYEWLHQQENFTKWFNAKERDFILNKGIMKSNIYSSETCFLVPYHVGYLFNKRRNKNGKNDLPIGIWKDNRRHGCRARYIYGVEKDSHLAKTTAYSYPTAEEAFYFGYKPSKEQYIKQVAQEEYDKGNITQRCYEAMMNYEVEITD